MAFKKRRMIFIPDLHPRSFVFFFERGNSGTSWSIRDYSVKNRVREYGLRDFNWTADEIHEKAKHSFDAPTHRTEDLTFWHEHTTECNRRYLPQTDTPEISTKQLPPLPAPRQHSSPFPMLNMPALLVLPKSRKTQDMERILHSPNSEDWMTWNFFQVLLKEHPSAWWFHLLSAVKRRNQEFNLPIDDQSIPQIKFWSCVQAPSEYEAQSRARMKKSNDATWVLRAANPGPVEGASEIDVCFDHPEVLVYVEAKLGSDVSMSTTFNPERNQIARNIDCLLENAEHRTPFFWMLVRDEKPGRAYVQLVNSYRADPDLLIRDLPHRNPEQLRRIAQCLTILSWSDLRALVSGPGWDEESAAVKRELDRRIDTQ